MDAGFEHAGMTGSTTIPISVTGVGSLAAAAWIIARTGVSFTPIVATPPASAPTPRGVPPRPGHRPDFRLREDPQGYECRIVRPIVVAQSHLLICCATFLGRD